jgi:hypothetical protein
MKTRTTKPRLAWRREKPKYVRFGPETHHLSRAGGDRLAIVQKDRDGSWFWYGGGRNTCANPTDLETAKAEAKAHVLSLGM